MIKILMPLNAAKAGGPLFEVASELVLFADMQKTTEGENLVYSVKQQDSIEPVLTEANILKIVDNGGDVINYAMYAEMPFQKDGVSIYECLVPEGMPCRTMKITDGTSLIEVVKNLGQWCDCKTSQTFSADLTKIYLMTNPLGPFLQANELKAFVVGFGAKLLTIAEYNSLNAS